MNKLIASLLFLCLSLGSQVTMSATVGGYTFDDNAYVDDILSSSGTYTTIGGSLTEVLTDTDEGTYAFSFEPGAFVQLGFTDNLLVNGTGSDLVLFELGIPDSFGVSLAIDGTTIAYATTDTGDTVGGFNLNAVAIDLDDFGVASGTTLSNFIVGMDIVNSQLGTVPSLSLAAALNSTVVPLPAAVWLFGSAMVGLVGFSRKKARIAAA